MNVLQLMTGSLEVVESMGVRAWFTDMTVKISRVHVLQILLQNGAANLARNYINCFLCSHTQCSWAQATCCVQSFAHCAQAWRPVPNW